MSEASLEKVLSNLVYRSGIVESLISAPGGSSLRYSRRLSIL
jgi:hypothetical protein